jgi:hypothetical protein
VEGKKQNIAMTMVITIPTMSTTIATTTIITTIVCHSPNGFTTTFTIHITGPFILTMTINAIIMTTMTEMTTNGPRSLARCSCSGYTVTLPRIQVTYAPIVESRSPI